MSEVPAVGGNAPAADRETLAPECRLARRDDVLEQVKGLPRRFERFGPAWGAYSEGSTSSSLGM